MASLFVLVLLGIAVLPIVLYTRYRTRHTRSFGGVSPFIFLIAILPGLLFFAIFSMGSEIVIPLIYLLLITGLAYVFSVWIREIVHVMGLSDEAFPGRNDKMLWLALIALMPVLGVPAFCIFRRAYWPSAKPVVDSVTREMA